MGWLVAIVVLPVLFAIVAAYAVLKLAFELVLALLPAGFVVGRGKFGNELFRRARCGGSIWHVDADRRGADRKRL